MSRRADRTGADQHGRFRFEEADTAVRQIEWLGHRPADVLQIILTHGDPDHAGGLADFPNTRAYTASEERAAIISGDWRYHPAQFAHGVLRAAPLQSSRG